MALTRWHTLVAALWAGITCGFLYTFGTFGTALEDKFDLGTGTNTISMCQVLCGLVTATAGLLVDRVGIPATLAVGVIVNVGAWVVFGILANGCSTLPWAVAIFSLLAAAATWGGACVTASVFTVLAKNFRENSSLPIGIAKAWVGVASGVATTAFLGFFPSVDDSRERLGYLWFLAAACFLGVAAAAPMLRLLTEPVHGDHLLIPLQWRYRFLTGITLLLIVVTVVTTLIDGSISDDERAGLSVLMLVIVCSPVVLLTPGRRRRDASAVQLMGDAQDMAAPPGPGGTEAPSRPESPWAGGPAVMLKRLDAYMLWFVIFSLQSGGILLTMNMGSIASSRGGGGSDAASATAFFSCAQSLGRLFGGSLSDLVVHRHFSRPTCFVALAAVMCAAQALLCLPGSEVLFIGTSLAGLAFGSMYPIMIITIGELFGTERIGSNYMVYDGSPGAVGSIAVGKLFAVWVYNAHTPSGSSTCVGDSCYRTTFMAVGALQLVAGVCALALALRSRIVYTMTVWSTPETCVSPATSMRRGADVGDVDPVETAKA